jgi:hypothetical protein
MIIMETKCCTKCGEYKPATTEFFPRQYDGLFSWCKPCKRSWQLVYNKSEAGRASQKKYDKTDKGKKTNNKGTKKYQYKTKGVYMITDNDGNCLYIGRSSQFNGRVVAHKHAVNNLEQAKKHRKSMLHLYEELAQYDTINFVLLGEYPREELKQMEQYYIQLYNPLYNKNSK